MIENVSFVLMENLVLKIVLEVGHLLDVQIIQSVSLHALFQKQKLQLNTILQNQNYLGKMNLEKIYI